MLTRWGRPKSMSVHLRMPGEINRTQGEVMASSCVRAATLEQAPHRHEHLRDRLRDLVAPLGMLGEPDQRLRMGVIAERRERALLAAALARALVRAALAHRG